MNLSAEPLITRVYGGLYIGNYVAACQKITFETHLLRRIVSVTDGRVPPVELYASLGVERTHFFVRDAPFIDKEKVLLKKIMPWIRVGCVKGILIHCMASISRSPGLTMAYLIWTGKKFEEALALVSLHPVAATPPDVLASFLAAVNADPPPPWYANWSRERLKNSEHIW